MTLLRKVESKQEKISSLKMNNYKKSWQKLISDSSDKFYLQKCLRVENLDPEIISWLRQKLSKLGE